ncbi:MAG: PAS domain S-box protein, partial [Actinobacteria bacterium]|nr:PAS domain S-box protein [Actinomycetota bacterium]
MPATAEPWDDLARLSQEPSPARRPHLAARGSRTIRLLVAASDPDLGRFLVDVLGGEYDVRLTADGQEALAIMRDGDTDLVLVEGTRSGFDGLELVRQIRNDPDLCHLPVVLLAITGTDVVPLGRTDGVDDHVEDPRVVSDLRARLTSTLATSHERAADASWRRAILFALSDPVLIFDGDGVVIELNQAFTRLLGYTMDDGPFQPPYPWWPTEDEDPDALQTILDLHTSSLRHQEIEAEVLFFSKDRRPIWVHSAGASIDLPLNGSSAHIRVLRDINHDREAQERRAAAAVISGEFSRAEDLETV